MPQNCDAAGSDEPEHCADRTRVDEQWDGHDQQASVQLASCGRECADREVLSCKLANAPHAADHEEDDEEECEVGDQAVDEEHDKDDGVVAREVAQVVVHA